VMTFQNHLITAALDAQRPSHGKDLLGLCIESINKVEAYLIFLERFESECNAL
jgi:hypothetical protein